MCVIKKKFDDIVRENTAFVIAIIRKHIRNPEMVKDLTQEIFIRAFKSYDSYVEQGKIKAWLAMIANNKLKNYFKYARYENSISLDFAFMQDEESSDTNLYNIISIPEENPEDIVIRNEFTEQIINVINSLPQIQRDVIVYRYIYNYSIEEVSKITNLPSGSVKSAGHYGLEKVKKLIGGEQFKQVKGKNNMDNMILTNKEAYALLYEYAKGHVSNEDKIAVETYLKTDAEAANIVSALKELHPKLTYAREDEMTHYNIVFVLKNGERVTYSNVSYHIEKYKEMNEYLEKHDGYTDGHWFEMGSNIETLATYDNEGNKLEMNVWHPDENNKRFYRSNVKRMKKVFYPVHWRNSVHYFEKSNPVVLGYFEKLKDAPNLYKAHTFNHFGNNTTVKSALYIAIPGNATNIRMIRGNGWHDCGTYKFAYTDRYVMGDEGNHAECTFNLE